MDRRTFLIRSAKLATGGLALSLLPGLAQAVEMADKAVQAASNGTLRFDHELYHRFANPDSIYHPFVRWWWNGDMVEIEELRRELRVMKAAGIGGVEINPIAFPTTGDDLGKRSLRWLSDEWIDMLKVTFDEAKRLDMTCDLLVGSGWPFGSEELPEDERAQVVLVDAERIEGPTTFEISKFTICKNVDPGVTDVNPLRTFDILSLKLVPNPMSGIDQAIDLSDQIGNEVISVDVPEGKFVFYALVRVKSFACVINGAPGAAGSILDHMNKKAVRKYLDHMAETIERRIGPLKNYIRAMFTDSMELEGCNWTGDFAEQFRLRRGYDLMPYLPFMMFKVGRLGDVLDYNYGAQKTPEFKAELERVRFDYELTKAELLKERFTDTYTQWCTDLGVKSRAQAYGRGFFEFFGAERVDDRLGCCGMHGGFCIRFRGCIVYQRRNGDSRCESGLYGTGTRRLRLCRNRRCCGLRSFRGRLNGRRRHCGCTGSGRCRRRRGIGCGFCRRRCSRSGCRDSGRRFCRRSRRPLDRSRLRSGRGSRLLCRLRTGRCGLRGGGPNQLDRKSVV